jgi:hypothetical protein
MKISKFNESNSDKLDEEYLSFIFSEFIDNKSEVKVVGTPLIRRSITRKTTGRVQRKQRAKYWQILLEEPTISNIFENIENYTKSIDEIYNFSKELESCFKRIDDDFPDAEYNLIIDEIVNEYGDDIFSRDVKYMPGNIKRTIIIEFEL